MKEIIIDGILYEAYEKKEPLLNPNPGDFIICTQPSFNFWSVYKILFIVIRGKKVVAVGENSNDLPCVIECTYPNFVKKYRLYDGEPGASIKDYSWWERKKNK